MKIEVKTMEEFLTKVRMSTIDSCLLEFKDDGMHLSAMDKSNVYGVKSHLNKTAFTEYAAIGNVGVDDLSKMIKIFKRLGKEISFEVMGNLMIVKADKKELTFELVDEKFIPKTPEVGDLKHNTTFTIPAETMSEFLKDAESNKDVTVVFETVENGVILTNDGKYKFKYNLDSQGTLKGEVVKFGAPIVSILKDISDGNLVCHVTTDYPMFVEHKNEKYNIRFMIAPRVDKEV